MDCTKLNDSFFTFSLFLGESLYEKKYTQKHLWEAEVSIMTKTRISDM